MKRLIYLLTIIIALSSCQRSGKQQANEHKQRTKHEAVQQATDKDKKVTDIHDTMPSYNGQEQNITMSDYDYTAPYICPNHCPGSGSDKPGKCQVCGMDLIPNPDYQKK